MNRFIPFALLLLPFLSYCQSNPPTCTDLRKCIVYTRSHDKHQPYRITIDGAVLTQINLVTGDSSVWNIHWVEQCGFIMSFLSGADYYLYDAYRDRIGHRPYAHDTLWIHPH